MGDVTPVGHVSRSLAALGLTITWTPSGSSAREGHTWRVSRYQRSRGAKGPGLPVSPIATAQRIMVVGRRSNASCLARRSAAGRSRPSHGGIGVSAFAESPQSCLTCCSPRSSKSSDSLLQQPVRFSGFACAAPDRCEAGRQMRVSFGERQRHCAHFPPCIAFRANGITVALGTHAPSVAARRVPRVHPTVSRVGRRGVVPCSRPA